VNLFLWIIKTISGKVAKETAVGKTKNMNLLNIKIILASKSPRRSLLLKEAGFQIEIKTKEVEENYPSSMPVKEVAPFLAEKKAMACKDYLESDSILLAADSVVVLDNEIFGKPKNRNHAIQILSKLSGRVHQVITGVCLLTTTAKRVFSGISEVHFQSFSQQEIEYYIDKYEPYDKAGSYAIQEWIGLCKISKIEGTYSNIMGLPMEQVYRNITELVKN